MPWRSPRAVPPTMCRRCVAHHCHQLGGPGLCIWVVLLAALSPPTVAASPPPLSAVCPSRSTTAMTMAAVLPVVPIAIPRSGEGAAVSCCTGSSRHLDASSVPDGPIQESLVGLYEARVVDHIGHSPTAKVVNSEQAGQL